MNSNLISSSLNILFREFSVSPKKLGQPELTSNNDAKCAILTAYHILILSYFLKHIQLIESNYIHVIYAVEILIRIVWYLFKY